ncbi:transporter substrate-binding domain-containing protein [Stenotrophomonas oahuensis]|uniref:Transporter substrate-binding domain-containing protein n=1 Tax=Stenotrophomonas oahuensis TaxID=3003271 RepID=A0ABY9YMM5_9GAMM|nr:transporter substrate-binding domain-containing protein [Stenotrophomonas sp. A5586]WNH51982.1 transporter substrate-binding domain-containing protein [Stenotrophomonas sp. A5586]
MSTARCCGAALLTVWLLALTAHASDGNRLIRVAADPSQHRLLTPETRAARDANLVSSYAQLVSQETGLSFREQRVESARAALQALCDGQADLMLLLGGLEGAPCNTLVASPAYYRGQALLASRHTHPNPPELTHLRRIAVIGGSRYAEWLASHHPNLQTMSVPTLREALAAVETGVADVALELDVAMRPLVRRDHGDSLLLHGAPGNLPGSLHLGGAAAGPRTAGPDSPGDAIDQPAGTCAVDAALDPRHLFQWTFDCRAVAALPLGTGDHGPDRAVAAGCRLLAAPHTAGRAAQRAPAGPVHRHDEP